MKRTTIVDVGRLAGVSAKTVSRVLNDEPHVSAAVKQRVREAVDTLDYHPNVFAQALVRRKSNMIGLIYENPSPSYVVELQRGVLERLNGERYRLVVIPILAAMREVKGVSYQFTAPWLLDDAATRTELGVEPTPWDEVLRVTALGNGADAPTASHADSQVERGANAA